MKKYKTKPIDFTGCHPVIAEHLKRGESIECRVWDSGREHDKGKGYVTGYELGIYITSDGLDWDRAEPIPLKAKRIMPPERAIPLLIAGGWKFNEYGNLVNKYGTMVNEYGDLVCKGGEISVSAFKCFGLSCETPEVASRYWPPCIIEEVEDE